MKYLIHDAAGNIVGNGETSQDALIDPNTIACTDAQYADPKSWVVVKENLVANPNAGALRLDQLKAAKIAEFSNACQAQIYAGFTSTALGTVHTYPAKDRDQSNLSGSVLASVLPGLPTTWTTPFWCMDMAGAWSLADHTAAQIQQVGTDGKAAILAAVTKNASLAAQVNAATTAAAVAAIVW